MKQLLTEMKMKISKIKEIMSFPVKIISEEGNLVTTRTDSKRFDAWLKNACLSKNFVKEVRKTYDYNVIKRRVK